MSSNALLRVENLRTYYYTKMRQVVVAVDGVNFEIGNNDALALIGESGCGKSTVARTIIRLLPSNARIVEGHVIFDGKIDLTRANEDVLRKLRFRKISIIFQGSMNMLDPVMKIEDQIAEVIKVHNRNTTKEEAIQQARRLLESVGIPPYKGKEYPHQLSGGQKQRVAIAMAIALKPSLIIADEAFTGLDVMVQAQLIELLNDLRKKMKVSLLFITHDIHVIGELCEKIAVMYAGKIVEYGDLKKISESPMHPYTMGLLNAVPTLDGSITGIRSIPGFPPNLSDPPPGCRFHPRCPYRFELCDKEEPQLVEVERGRYVACHLLTRG